MQLYNVTISNLAFKIKNKLMVNSVARNNSVDINKVNAISLVFVRFQTTKYFLLFKKTLLFFYAGTLQFFG